MMSESVNSRLRNAPVSEGSDGPPMLSSSTPVLGGSTLGTCVLVAGMPVDIQRAVLAMIAGRHIAAAATVAACA